MEGKTENDNEKADLSRDMSLDKFIEVVSALKYGVKVNLSSFDASLCEELKRIAMNWNGSSQASLEQAHSQM